jgi:NUMOD3 motif
VYNNIKPTISDLQKQRMTGRVPTQAHRIKMSNSLKGRPKSPEHIEKMREAKLGKPGHKWTEQQRIKYQNRIEELGGPMLGKSHSEESRAKMSAGQKARMTPEERARRSERSRGENNPMFGRKQTEEAKKKMSRLGMKHSEETKAKMRAARANQPGRPLSEETKRKISEAHKRRHQTKNFI